MYVHNKSKKSQYIVVTEKIVKTRRHTRRQNATSRAVWPDVCLALPLLFSFKVPDLVTLVSLATTCAHLSPHRPWEVPVSRRGGILITWSVKGAQYLHTSISIFLPPCSLCPVVVRTVWPGTCMDCRASGLQWERSMCWFCQINCICPSQSEGVIFQTVRCQNIFH